MLIRLNLQINYTSLNVSFPTSAGFWYWSGSTLRLTTYLLMFPFPLVSISWDPCLLSGTAVGQTDFDIPIWQCLTSDRNLAWVILVRHKRHCPTIKSKSVCSHSSCMYSLTVVRLCLAVYRDVWCYQARSRDHFSISDVSFKCWSLMLIKLYPQDNYDTHRPICPTNVWLLVLIRNTHRITTHLVMCPSLHS